MPNTQTFNIYKYIYKYIKHKYIYRIVPNRRALPNRRPPSFLDVKQSINMYLSDAQMQQSRCYNY